MGRFPREKKKIAVETMRVGDTDQKFSLPDEDSPHFIKRESTRKYFPECRPNKNTIKAPGYSSLRSPRTEREPWGC